MVMNEECLVVDEIGSWQNASCDGGGDSDDDNSGGLLDIIMIDELSIQKYLLIILNFI